MIQVDLILAVLAKATPQVPMRDSDVYAAACKKQRVKIGEFVDALAQATEDRLISTCRITRGGVTQDVYWPTGLKTPVLTGLKPKEPLIVPNPDTHDSRLIKVIVAHGPLIGAELAEKAGLPAKNIDPYLASAIKNGTIHTRMGFVAELGKERKHYMTATQAEAWDANQGHVMSHPQAMEAAASVVLDGDTHYADDVTLARLAGLERQTEADRQTIHDLRNDVAARDLILHALADKLQVEQIEAIPAALDDLTHALATRAMTGAAPGGRMALLLIDSGDLTEVEELPTTDPDDAHQRAMAAVEQGHAARAVVVRIQGEARRHVEWKEAA